MRFCRYHGVEVGGLKVRMVHAIPLPLVLGFVFCDVRGDLQQCESDGGILFPAKRAAWWTALNKHFPCVGVCLQSEPLMALQTISRRVVLRLFPSWACPLRGREECRKQFSLPGA